MNCDRCNKSTNHLRIVIIADTVLKYCRVCVAWHKRNWQDQGKRDEWNSLSGQESQQGVKE